MTAGFLVPDPYRALGLVLKNDEAGNWHVVQDGAVLAGPFSNADAALASQ